MRNNLSVVIITIIILLMSAGIYLSIDSYGLKRRIAEKEREFIARISEERDILKKSLQERYGASMASYEEMYKMMEAQKKKVREIEDKLRKTDGNS